MNARTAANCNSKPGTDASSVHEACGSNIICMISL